MDCIFNVKMLMAMNLFDYTRLYIWKVEEEEEKTTTTTAPT